MIMINIAAKRQKTDQVIKEPESRPVFGQAVGLFTLPARALSHHAEKHYRSRYHGRYRTPRRIFAFDLALIGLVLILAVFSLAEFLTRPLLPEIIRVEMAAKPGAPRSGDRVTLAFSYENRSRVEQKEAEIALRLPRGFLMEPAEIPGFQTETQTLQIGDLAPGEEGSFEISGALLAVPGTPFQAAAVISARDGKTGASRILAETFTLPVSSSALAVDLQIPQTAVGGQEVSATLSYRNEGNAAIAEAMIVPLLPEGTEIVGSQPDLVEGVWRLLDIAPGSAGRMALRIRLPGAEKATVGASLSFRVEDQLIPQGVTERKVSLVSPAVTLRSSADRAEVGPGEKLTLRIEAENKGEFTLRNGELRLDFDPGLVDLDETRPFLTSAEAPGLAEFRPGDRLSAEIVLSLLTDLTMTGEEPMPPVLGQRLTLVGELDGYGRVVAAEEQVEYPVRSALRLRAAARYFTPEGEQIGRGPLPPRVGKETRYWIFLDIESSPGDAREVVVEGKLSRGVSWIDLQSVGAPGAEPIVYDPGRRMVRWKIPRLGGAIRTATYGAAFAVELLPEAGQAGDLAALLEMVTIRGIDDSTGKEISATALEVTTELAADARAEGKWNVTE